MQTEGGHCLVMMHKQHVFCKSTETGFFWVLERFRINVFRPVRVQSSNWFKTDVFHVGLKRINFQIFTKS
jgi:hypothetical protein